MTRHVYHAECHHRNGSDDWGLYGTWERAVAYVAAHGYGGEVQVLHEGSDTTWHHRPGDSPDTAKEYASVTRRRVR